MKRLTTMKRFTTNVRLENFPAGIHVLKQFSHALSQLRISLSFQISTSLVGLAFCFTQVLPRFILFSFCTMTSLSIQFQGRILCTKMYIFQFLATYSKQLEFIYSENTKGPAQSCRHLMSRVAV